MVIRRGSGCVREIEENERLNFGGHLGAGWVLAHAARLDRHERRWVVVMAVLPDVDGVFLLWHGSALGDWHRTFGHNVWVWLLAPLAGLMFATAGRRLLVLGLAYAAMTSHVVLDLFATGWWGMYPFWPWGLKLLWPFKGAEILMTDYLPENVMKWLIQPVLIAVFVGAMVWIYIRHRRTPLEVISPNVDSLLMNFVTLPWRERCGECGGLAFYRCSQCGRPLCPTHRTITRRLDVQCRPQCPERENL